MTERLYLGEGFFAIAKPPGRLVIPGRESPPLRSLREELAQELGAQVFVVHRLDRDTSGVLLFASTPKAHRTLSMAFEEGRIRKTYLALVEGELKSPLELDAPLVPARRGRMRLARPGEDGKQALTHVRPLRAFGGASLVEALPVTGRTHQIRVHLAGAGFPLLFDHQYGRKAPLTAAELGGQGPEVVLARTPLHCQRLELPALEGIAPVTIEAPLPADLQRAVELLAAQSTK